MRDFPINKHELNLYMSEASEAERQSTVSAYASRITAGVPLTKEAVRQNIKRQIKSQPKKNDTNEENVPVDKARVKNAIADIVSTIICSTPVAVSVDILAAGATLEQALIGRLIALPVNITSARPYGLFRDKIFTTLQLNAESPVWKRTIADSAAMLMFQTCTYAGILTTAGLVTGKPFTLIEIGTAVLTVAPVMLVIGRPFAWIRNFIRKNIFKLQNVD